MTATYEKIATTTLGSDTLYIDFTSIAGTYTDLVLITNHFMTASCTVGMRFNSDTGSNYSTTNLRGNGSTASSGRESSATAIQNTLDDIARNPNTANAVTIWNVQNYSNSTTYKTVILRHNNATSDAAGVSAGVGLWRNTNAITAIRLLATSSAQSFKSGSTFTLYGIKAE
jgi:hypothetical protein